VLETVDHRAEESDHRLLLNRSHALHGSIDVGLEQIEERPYLKAAGGSQLDERRHGCPGDREALTQFPRGEGPLVPQVAHGPQRVAGEERSDTSGRVDGDKQHGGSAANVERARGTNSVPPRAAGQFAGPRYIQAFTAALSRGLTRRAVARLLVLLLVAGCGGGSTSIVGAWQLTSGNGHPASKTALTMQFFKDGTFAWHGTAYSPSATAAYTLPDDSHFKLTDALSAQVFGYYIDGDTLTYVTTWSDGTKVTAVFQRTS